MDSSQISESDLTEKWTDIVIHISMRSVIKPKLHVTVSGTHTLDKKPLKYVAYLVIGYI